MKIKKILHIEVTIQSEKGHPQYGGKYLQIMYVRRNGYPEYIDNSYNQPKHK